MLGFIFFIFIAGIVAVVAIVAYKQKTRALNNWELAAKSLGLRFSNGGIMLPSSMTGKLDGHEVSVRMASRGSGKSRRTVTEYTIRYSTRVPFKFSLTRQHFLHSFGKMFGMQDIEVGDKTFDDSVVVQGENESEIRDFLTAPRRKHIKTALRSFKEIKITDAGIEVVTNGMENSLDKLRSTVKTLCAMAEVIVPSRKEDHPVEKAKKARETGDIANAIEIIAAAEGLNEDETMEINEIEGELRYLCGDTERASEIFDNLSKELDDDEHSKQWRQLAEDKTPPPLPSEDEKVPTESVTTAEENAEVSTTPSDADDKNDSPPSAIPESNDQSSETISIDDFCGKLFAKNMGAFDSTKLFDSEFKDKSVDWNGKLVSASTFSFDFVFKDGGGVKATFEMLELKSEYSSTKVKAIVRYPEEKLDELKKRIGEENVEFSGKLISLDGLTKNIFIA
ncbi:MAG: hypothetical protein GXP32_08915 [Kiritimatiellaeota bacterium]|nr:hypothetical protein [Kiritimatiellota bacterium]